MTRILEITACAECPFADKATFGNHDDLHCRKMPGKGGSMYYNADKECPKAGIPEWCPLLKGKPE